MPKEKTLRRSRPATREKTKTVSNQPSPMAPLEEFDLLPEATEQAYAEDYQATRRIGPILKELNAHHIHTVDVLSILWTKLSHVQISHAKVWKLVSEVMRRELTCQKKSLSVQAKDLIRNPPSPPVGLKERLTRNDLLELQHRARNLEAAIQLVDVAETVSRKVVRAFEYRGSQVQKVAIMLVILMVRARMRIDSAAKYTHRLLQAWNTRIAPTSADSVRVIYQRYKAHLKKQ